MAKKLNGIVTSAGSKNTAVVQVSRRVPHSLYKKLIAKSKKYKIETAGVELTVGDDVIIEEIKPVSKDKHFKLVSITTDIKEVRHV